jgi:hypothetical protein
MSSTSRTCPSEEDIIAVMKNIYGAKKEEKKVVVLSNRKLLKETMKRKYPLENDYSNNQKKIYQYFLIIYNERNDYNNIIDNNLPCTEEFIKTQKKLLQKFKCLKKTLYGTFTPSKKRRL